MTDSIANHTQGLNQGGKENPSKTLHQRIAFSGRIGWILAVLFAGAFVVQSWIYVAMPRPLQVVDESGQLRGRIVWDTAKVRGRAELSKDIKAWVTSYYSTNAATIWEDAQLALNHMTPELRAEQFEEWKKTSYLKQIAESENVSNIVFDDDFGNEFDGIILQKDKNGYFSAVVEATVKIGLVNPTPYPIKMEVEGFIVSRTEARSLGIEVEHYAEI